jgi:hypothetical protein
MITPDTLERLAAGANNRLAAEYRLHGFGNPPIITLGMVRCLLDEIEESKLFEPPEKVEADTLLAEVRDAMHALSLDGDMPSEEQWDALRPPHLPRRATLMRRFGCRTAHQLADLMGLRHITNRRPKIRMSEDASPVPAPAEPPVRPEATQLSPKGVQNVGDPLYCCHGLPLRPSATDTAPLCVSRTERGFFVCCCR